MERTDIRNIGIFAHVDAGKTTLSEQLLAHSGAIRIRGSGVTFVSQVPQRTLTLRYQHQVEQGLPMALGQGRLGWQVTDVKITLIDGNEHQWHTHPLDFIVAT